jgi:DHA1 family multidrug resistance protein-like MFS transporter
VVLAAAVVSALGGALFEASGKAALASLAPPEGRARLFALSATVASMGVVVGPLIGAALLPLRFAAVGVAAGAFFFAAFVLSAALLPALGGAPAGAPPLAATLRGVARDRRFLAFTALLAGYWFLHNQIYVSIPLWATRLTGQPRIVGVLNAVFAVAGVSLQFPLVRLAGRRWPPAQVAAAGLGAMGGGLALVGAGAAAGLPALAVLVAAVVVFAAGRALVEPTKDVLTASMAPESGLAAYFGVAFLALAVGGSAGNFAGGWLYDVASSGGGPFALPWLVFALVGLSAAAGFVAFGRRLRAGAPG